MQALVPENNAGSGLELATGYEATCHDGKLKLNNKELTHQKSKKYFDVDEVTCGGYTVKKLKTIPDLRGAKAEKILNPKTATATKGDTTVKNLKIKFTKEGKMIAMGDASGKAISEECSFSDCCWLWWVIGVSGGVLLIVVLAVCLMSGGGASEEDEDDEDDDGDDDE